MREKHQIIVVGGGLAGLCCSIQLSKAGYDVLLIERHSYPRHKVCGEYISNEVLDHLKSLGLDPFTLGAKNITQFEFTGPGKASLHIDLPLGGFGISRFTLDQALYQLALEHGVKVQQQKVRTLTFEKDAFIVETDQNSYAATFVIGAFGKRSVLDKTLSRKFSSKRTPWVAVKAHYNGPQLENVVGLHHFEGGYCGLSQIETAAVNACYLVHDKVFKRYKNISDFTKNVLYQNRHLSDFFEQSDMLYEKPLTISQIAFERKSTIENHILMIGDSAGLIHPLCGNGMAMAIHSAKLVSDLLIHHKLDPKKRLFIEKAYAAIWKERFYNRMRTGKWIQKGLLHKPVTQAGVALLSRSPRLLTQLIKATHGDRI